jgi:hypothetical protein
MLNTGAPVKGAAAVAALVDIDESAEETAPEE